MLDGIPRAFVLLAAQLFLAVSRVGCLTAVHPNANVTRYVTEVSILNFTVLARDGYIYHSQKGLIAINPRVGSGIRGRYILKYKESFEEFAVPDAAPEDKILVIAPGWPGYSTNWYHILIEHGKQLFGLLRELELWDPTTGLKLPVDVVLMNRRDGQFHRARDTYHQFLQLHFGVDSVFTNWPTFWDSTGGLHGYTPIKRYTGAVMIKKFKRAVLQPDAMADDFQGLRHRTVALMTDNTGSPEERQEEAPKKLMLVTRKQGSLRSFLNQLELKHMLQAQCTSPSNELSHYDCSGSFQRQFKAFHEADVVVAAHGACLANSLWMRPNTALVEIFPHPIEQYPSKYWDISNMMSLRYFNSVSMGETDAVNFNFAWADKLLDGAEVAAEYEDLEDEEMPEEQVACVHENLLHNAHCRKLLTGGGIVANLEEVKELVLSAYNTSYQPTQSMVQFDDVTFLRSI